MSVGERALDKTAQLPQVILSLGLMVNALVFRGTLCVITDH
jgi:hypothetical protein